ncbi:MarR family transcriptional regulator [Amphritea opalescens]|uniref:MarR family transcriptional regulator n=1 Tax=Amphritea opalescens TaxID=2490544 RepID=A0A430KRC0_9GAMM|nr:helix-turn-helix domain-containing protein [Amphritea opalescens]RTE65894.1 MarR family transcriptional regulator [Amphritea opalescens]
MSKSIDALARGMLVLEEIIRHSPVSLAELHRITDISKATLLRILKTLIEAGWIIRSDEMGGYLFANNLSSPITNLDLAATFHSVAAPAIQQLSQESATLTGLWAPQNNKVSVISSSPVLYDTLANDCSQTTLTSAIGLAYLSFSSEAERTSALHKIKAQEGRESRLIKQESPWLQKTIIAIKNQGYAYHNPRMTNRLCGSHLEIIAFPITRKNNSINILSLSREQKNQPPLNIDTDIMEKIKNTIIKIEKTI